MPLHATAAKLHVEPPTADSTQSAALNWTEVLMLQWWFRCSITAKSGQQLSYVLFRKFPVLKVSRNAIAAQWFDHNYIGFGLVNCSPHDLSFYLCIRTFKFPAAVFDLLIRICKQTSWKPTNSIISLEWTSWNINNFRLFHWCLLMHISGPCSRPIWTVYEL